MNIKFVLYFIFIPISMWIVLSTNIDKIFKKNSVIQIHLMYFFLSLGLSYIIVNFLTDLYNIISL